MDKRIKHVEDHPVEDVLGSEIQNEDVYFVFGNEVVLEENLKDYLFKNKNVECYRVQKQNATGSIAEMYDKQIQTLKDAKWLIGKLAGSLGVDIDDLEENYNNSYNELTEIIEQQK